MVTPSRDPRIPRSLKAGLVCRPPKVLADESTLRTRALDLDRRGVCVTAPGMETDFVSRFFAPRLGIPEDPVTGSAHCELAPYWAGHLGRTALSARQVSRRGGEIACRLEGDRVLLAGHAVTFLVGEMKLET